MTTLTWSGGSGSWTDAAQWLGDIAPLPDETEIVNAGTVIIPSGGSLDAATVDLGAASFAAAGTDFGARFTIDSTGLAVVSNFVTYASVGFAGTIDATASGGSFAIGTNNGALILFDAAQLNVSGGDTVGLDGTIANHGTITVGSGGSFTNDGTIAQASGAFEVEQGGTLAGDGVFQIGLYSSLYLQQGSAPSGQSVAFTDPGGRLLLADPANYSGIVENFQTGDLIDLTATIANGASYDAADGVLGVTENGGLVATLHLADPAGSGFTATSDGATGTLIQLAGTLARTKYTIAGPDQAMGSNLVRADMTTAAGAPITGAGVKIGIISDSFDANPGLGAADPANAAALAGYLPLNAATDTAAVTVLNEGSFDSSNEGMAMAEEVYQVAPGAQLYFASGEGGESGLANAVTALAQAGCNVIVDDLSYLTEPFFQDAGPVNSAIDNAVAGGVSYFTAAGNDADASFQASYAPQSVTLDNGLRTEAEIFSNGTPYQTITLLGGVTTTIALQWAAPFPANGQPIADPLALELFNAAGQVVATSSPVSGEPEITLSITPIATTQYQLAIQGDLAAGTLFKYVLAGSAGGGSEAGGTIDDPAADNAGTVIGHAMLPEVNTVGAINFALTPRFSSSASYPDDFSAAGPATLLYDAAGDPLLARETLTKPDLLAPDGAATTVFAPFDGTSAAAPDAAAVAALMLQADPALTPAQVTSLLESTATDLGLPQDEQGYGLVDAPGAVQRALDAATGEEVACFAAGTRLATARGPVAVERLGVGDLLRTAAGRLVPAVWLGRRRIDPDHARAAELAPVRIAAHAFAPGQPARDLLLSPDHAVFADGVLIPVRRLVNGATILRGRVARVTYWHVELPAHDVLLAEGLPVESYLDTGNRARFEGCGRAAPPAAAAVLRIWAERGCAPLVLEGAPVAAVRRRLLQRAHALGHAVSHAPRLALLAGRRALAPERAGPWMRFRLPPRTRRIRLVSRTWVPAEMDSRSLDPRCLGVAVDGLRLDGATLRLDDDARLLAGWHDTEPGWRWTAGDAVIAVAGGRELAVRLALTGRYWRRPPPLSAVRARAQARAARPG